MVAPGMLFLLECGFCIHLAGWLQLTFQTVYTSWARILSCWQKTIFNVWTEWKMKTDAWNVIYCLAQYMLRHKTFVPFHLLRQHNLFVSSFFFLLILWNRLLDDGLYRGLLFFFSLIVALKPFGFPLLFLFSAASWLGTSINSNWHIKISSSCFSFQSGNVSDLTQVC